MLWLHVVVMRLLARVLSMQLEAPRFGVANADSREEKLGTATPREALRGRSVLFRDYHLGFIPEANKPASTKSSMEGLAEFAQKHIGPKLAQP